MLSAPTFLIFFVATFPAQEIRLTRPQAIERMRPYAGNAVKGVSRDSLAGKVLCGYQGWFTAPGDGSGRGWSHYGKGGAFRPGKCSIDLWPDVTDLDADERFATPFRYADGTVAQVFSSHRRKTVLRHFRWMREYGIDGVFVQRFAVELADPLSFNHCNVVLGHCREGANLHGRTYAVMYDLSGLRAKQMNLVREDWKLLIDRMRIGHDSKDEAYLRHMGKPVVAVWGIGFNDGRAYTLAECGELIDFWKRDPAYGGCTVLVGVPSGWRTLDADAVADKGLHAVLRKADVISPWTVGRYDSPRSAKSHTRERWQPDLAWCREHGMDYLPVVFPGFSWHNLKPGQPFNQIPRLKGQFLWTQYVAAKRTGATMIYQAMFDELDEGTAIFKSCNRPPTGPTRFVAEQGVPSDHYLWLAGMGGRLLRGEVAVTEKMPKREKAPLRRE